MRKRLFAISILQLILLLTACASPAPEPEAEQKAEPITAEQPPAMLPAFQLEELPELAPYEPPREIVKRYSNEEFVDTLVAADDYGRLYPYVGKLINSGDFWANDQRYGLVDAQGRIVVDPVYQYVYHPYNIQRGHNYSYLLLCYPMDRSDEQIMAVANNSGWVKQTCRYVVAATDGSWVSGDFFGDNILFFEDRVFVTDYSAIPSEYWVGRNMHYRVYDLDGKLLAENDGHLRGFSEGMGLVYDADEERGYWYYIDKQGQTAIEGPFLQAEYFDQGRAEVAMEEKSGRYLRFYIDHDGNQLTEPMPVLPNYGPGGYVVFPQDGLYSLRNAENIEITPPQYRNIDFPQSEQPTVALGRKPDDSYWLIDLPSGQARKIDLDAQASLWGEDWCVAAYFGNVVTPWNPEGDSHRGLAFIRGDITHYVGYEDFVGLDYAYISGDMFALSYYRPEPFNRITLRLDFYDAQRGEVVKSLDGFSFTQILNNNLLILRKGAHDDYQNNNFVALNLDFTPAFSLEMDTFTSIDYVADDVYAVRTTLYSGLIRENGEWLLRVNINTVD